MALFFRAAVVFYYHLPNAKASHFKYLHNAHAKLGSCCIWPFSLTQTLFDSYCCSTREIKPNQTDIGRKITKKPSAITSSLYNNRTTASGQPSSTTPNSLISNGKRQLDSSERGPSSGDGQQPPLLSHLTSQQQLSATSSHSNYNITSSQDHHHDPYQHHNNSALNGVVVDDGDHQRTSSNHNLSRSSGQQNHRNPDIMRKPIKWVFDAIDSRFTDLIYFFFFDPQGKTYTLISIKAI